MSDDNGVETPTTDDLDVSLIEEEPITEVSTDVEKVLIDDQEVPYDEVINAYKNKGEWQKSNTQKAQEIAEERRRLDSIKSEIEQREQNLRAWEQGMYQGRGQTQLNEQPPQQFNLSQEELDLMTPYERKIYEYTKAQDERWQQWQQEQQKKEFTRELEARHSKIKSQHPDYDPVSIERSFIQGREPFEDAFFADKYKAITKGDKNALLSLVPDDIKSQWKEEAKKEVIEDLRKKQQQRQNLGTAKPDKGGLIKQPSQKAKNYFDATQSALRSLQEEGVKLTG